MPTPLHRRLWVVVAAALLPTATLSSIALLLLQKEQEAEVAGATIETMRAMLSAVDGELHNTVAVAETLAASDALHKGDLAAFYEEARRVARVHPQWVTIALSDRSGQQVLNVLQPLDTPLESEADRDSFKRVVTAGRPAVGNLVMAESGERSGIAVRVPVLRGRSVERVITVLLSPDTMLEVIRRQRVTSEGVVSIFDARGRHVARSRLHEHYLGQPGSTTLQKLMVGQYEGWGPSVTLEGQSIYAAFSRSRQSGWIVAVGIPTLEINAAVQQSFATVGIGLLLSIALGVLASLMMARLVTGPIGALRAAAQAVGRGEVPEVRPIRIAEINEVAQALVGAARAR
jgi:HAMP domain-containing protein